MKTILVTGVSTGIGRSFVCQAAALPDTTIIAMTRSPLPYTTPSNVDVYEVDLTDFEAVTEVVEHILTDHPTIDVLINNAGNGWRGMIEDTTITEAKAQLDVNVWALLHLSNQILPVMRKQRHGHIINVSSVAASINYGTIGYYSATKAFIEKMSEVLAVEVEPWNIQVSLLAPGAVKTKFGHNMVNIKRYKKGPYKKEYEKWADRFETMFQKPLSSDTAARKLIRLIDKPKAHTYLSPRDAIYCYIKKIIPRKVFNMIFLKRYMNL